MIEFVVVNLFKGTEPDRVEVRTQWSGICDQAFEVGGRYLVYATQSDGSLWTNPFMRTTILGNAEKDIRKLTRRFGER